MPKVRAPGGGELNIDFNPFSSPQASWLQSDWYVDPVNGDDTKAGDTPARAVKTIMGGIVAKWCTPNPTLPQNTTIHLLNGETLDQEYVGLGYLMVSPPGSTGGSMFGIVGTPALVAGAPTVLGTVTAKNRTGAGGGNPLSVDFASVANLAVGQMIVNTKRTNSWAMIESINGNVVTIDQPLAAMTFADATIYPTPAENDAWATGDTIEVYTLPLLNLKYLNPRGGDTSATFQGGLTWVQNVHIPDVSGTPGNASFAPQSDDQTIIFVGCKVDAYVETGPGPEVYQSLYWIGCAMEGGGAGSYNTILGGHVHTYPWAMLGSCDMDLDTICRVGITCQGPASNIGYAFVVQGTSVGVLVYNGAMLVLQDDLNGTSGATLYGTANINVRAGGTFLQSSGGTWETRVYTSGTMSFGISETTTGTSYPGWVDGITVNPANLDAHNGCLMNPRINARFCNAE